MEFCPKCGTVMMPKMKGKGMKLVCSDCGKWRKIKREEDYKFGESKQRKIEGVIIIEEGDIKKKRRREEEYEIDTDAYAELYESY